MSSRRIRHILELSQQERKEFLDSFDCVLTDCDGVLWTVFEPIPGVGAGLTGLLAAGKTIRYITNNSVRSLASYSAQLRTLGVTLDPADLIHPAKSIVGHLKSINFRGLIYCLGTDSFKGVLREGGFEVVDGPNEPLQENFRDIIGTVDDRAPVRAVVVDVDFNVNYPKLLRAEFYLKTDPTCLLVAGATDRVLNTGRGFNLIGPGRFLDILERSTGRKAIVLGKPGEVLARQVVKEYGIRDPGRVLMVGDMMEQDVAFGSRCGFQRLLVLSGGASREDMMKEADGACVPDYYADSLADFKNLFEC
ncbi:glycerol-3-phosphate phosphatase [Culex quinquefasciatus]|uniref:glycerol-3-phosphate phosphatase n=1 Tax=Culex quinquefasciatus TaxID=7176 RepID=UPI0018E35675|nr:glycerol-3-phosphate phosphatase [Culex quinquefasciatus]